MCWEPDPQQRSSVFKLVHLLGFSNRLERGRLDWNAVVGKGFDGKVDNHFFYIIIIVNCFDV